MSTYSIPLLGSHPSGGLGQSSRTSLLIGAFLLVDSFCRYNMINILTITVYMYSLLADPAAAPASRAFEGVIFAVCLRSFLWLCGAWEAIEGYSLAILSGVLLHSVATFSLPAWDSAHQTSFGFTLSAIAVLSLFVGMSLLELIN